MFLSKIDLCTYLTMLTLMKFRIPALCLALLALSCPLAAEEAEVEEKVIPEVSEAPYEVGDHATIQGHYISLEDGISMNVRIVDNLVHIYWVDMDDLIVEPQSTGGNLRFVGSVRGATYHGLAPKNQDAALVSSNGLVLPPHIFNVILNLEPLGGGDLNNFSFRYLPTMDPVRETRELDGSSTD